MGGWVSGRGAYEDVAAAGDGVRLAQDLLDVGERDGLG